MSRTTFWVTMTLTADLVFRIGRVRSISHILFELGIPSTNVLSSLTIFDVCLHLGMAECHVVNVL